MKTIECSGWKIQCDEGKTGDYYSEIQFGHSDSCDCNDCLVYRKFKKSIFPKEFVDLLCALKIDIRKEYDVSVIETKNGMVEYSGFYYFFGNILCDPAGSDFSKDSIINLGDEFKYFFSRNGKEDERIRIEFIVRIRT